MDSNQCPREAGGATAPVRVVTVDDQAVVRAGLKAILAERSGLEVVGEAPDGSAAVPVADELAPDVVVAEVATVGPEVVSRLCGHGHKVLVLTACDDPNVLRSLVVTGVSGYVLKRAPADELVAAIRAVAAGGTYINPAVAGAPDGAGDPAGTELSEREREVLRLIAWGFSNKEIAARLRLSVKTVETYKSRSMEKLELRGRVAIVRYAARCGWLSEGSQEFT